MISFFDAEGNVPLHSAIHSGDFKVTMERMFRIKFTDCDSLLITLTLLRVTLNFRLSNCA